MSSTEKLSSPCHNQWFDTVSTNLGTSLGFDHNNEKKCAFPHARHIYSLENYFTRGRCRLAWRVLTLTDENYRGEPHEILVKCFKNFVYPWFARKKRQIPNGISKYFIHWSIYELFNNSPRKKQNWNNGRIGQMNSFFFNKEFVGSFFPLNLRGSQFFVTAEDKHLWNVSETLKEFTLPVTFSSLLFICN